jgi:hypothetical protein
MSGGLDFRYWIADLEKKQISHLYFIGIGFFLETFCDIRRDGNGGSFCL